MKQLQQLATRTGAAKIVDADAACTLAVKAIPNAPRNEIVGWLGDALKVKVHAPAVEGRANAALCEFLADTFRLPRRAVTVIRGDTARQKLVRLEGITLAAIRAQLAAAG